MKAGDPFYSSKQWRAVRLLALQRDLFRCTVCGRDIGGLGQARVDHVLPRETHPELAYDMTNLRSLCPRHDAQGHREKGKREHTGERIERFHRGVGEGGWPG